VEIRIVKQALSVSDEVWPQFPKHGPQTEAGQRLFFEVVVFVLRQGLGWRALPQRFGFWNTVFVRFNRYAKVGVWERLFTSLSPKVIAECMIKQTPTSMHSSTSPQHYST
jgi:transposase